MAPSKPTVKVSYLATRLGFSPQAIRDQIAKGLIPAARLTVRGQYRIPVEVAEAIIARFTTPAKK